MHEKLRPWLITTLHKQYRCGAYAHHAIELGGKGADRRAKAAVFNMHRVDNHHAER